MNNLKNKFTGITIYKPLPKVITTEVYDSYWHFATLRQEVFFNRFAGKHFPWSADTIINKFKFTNAYRASDRVSQYLIKNVIYNEDFPSSPKEVLFRILLFKLFNKIETWELLKSKIGNLNYEDYNFKQYDEVLTKALSEKTAIYSAAYIMPSGKTSFGYLRKHSNHLKLLERILNSNTAQKLSETIHMQQAFELLKSFPGIGDFLAYQLLIDINYSTILNFSESEFVIPGPGAKGGISKCFLNCSGLSNEDIIKLMMDRQEIEFERLQLPFKSLWGRRLQLIDCQNLFCEVDKYARVKFPNIKGNSNRVRIKQIYKHNNTYINYWFPPKWNINDKIKRKEIPQIKDC